MTSPRTLVLHERYRTLDDLYAHYGGGSFRVDLGCGFVKPPGFIGIDNLSGIQTQIPNEENAPDVLMDLSSSPLPFADGSCEEIRSSHFLEHSNLLHILAESHRCLRTGGIFLFAVPYANSAEGMYPGHSQFLTEKWFRENLTFRAKFEVDRQEFTPSDDWLANPAWVRRLIPFRFARTHLFNACSQMIVWAHTK